MKDNIPLDYILNGRVTHRLGWNREDQTFSPHYIVLSTTPPTHYNRSTFRTSIARHANTSFALLRSDMQHWHPKLAHNHLTRALLGGGGGAKRPLCTFPSIAQKRKGIELRNFRNLFLHQFYTCWLKENFAPMIGRPWETSEWRHVLPF